ncbi:MAG: polysaccharide biosynthesis protein, partial [Chloroflexota bacterium]
MSWRDFLPKFPLTAVPIRNRFLLTGDIFLVAAAVLGSFALRLEFGPLFVYYFPQAIRMVLLALLIKPAIYYIFGLYRRLWAYASAREMILITAAVSAASVVLSLVVTLMTYFQTRSPGYLGFPRSVVVIDWLLSVFLAGGLRFASRIIAESRSTAAGDNDIEIKPRRVLIVGAGDAGALVIREIQKNPQLNLTPICFLDDDPAKQKSQIHEVQVVGVLEDLAATISSKQIEEVVIAIPTAPGKVVRHVADVCREKNIPFRTMPGVYELIGGKVSVNRLRSVNINDLLRRASAMTDDRRVGSILAGRRVMVTGAGGSIGLEICRQISRWNPSVLILLGHGENSIYEAVLDLKGSHPDQPLHPVIADIRDRDRIAAVFEDLRPQVIFHAAAHKHVPLMELNVEEAITNNVLGTRNVVEIAMTYDVDHLVMISTDKAIRPTSVMGAT